MASLTGDTISVTNLISVICSRSTEVPCWSLEKIDTTLISFCLIWLKYEYDITRVYANYEAKARLA